MKPSALGPPFLPALGGVRMRQVETKHAQLHAHAADDTDAFAEIDLRMARRMGQWHEGLARPGAGDPNVILHDR
jgi:hypothetical protein